MESQFTLNRKSNSTLQRTKTVTTQRTRSKRFETQRTKVVESEHELPEANSLLCLVDPLVLDQVSVAPEEEAPVASFDGQKWYQFGQEVLMQNQDPVPVDFQLIKEED